MTAKRQLGVPTRCAPPAHPSRSYPGSGSHPAVPQGLPASPSLQTHDNWHMATLPLIQRYESHHHPATLPLITQSTDTHEHLHRLLQHCVLAELHLPVPSPSGSRETLSRRSTGKGAAKHADTDLRRAHRKRPVAEICAVGLEPHAIAPWHKNSDGQHYLSCGQRQKLPSQQQASPWTPGHDRSARRGP